MKKARVVGDNSAGRMALDGFLTLAGLAVYPFDTVRMKYA